ERLVAGVAPDPLARQAILVVHRAFDDLVDPLGAVLELDPDPVAGLELAEVEERAVLAVPRDVGRQHGGAGMPRGGTVAVPADLGRSGYLELPVVLQADRNHRIVDEDAVDREPDQPEPRFHS